MPEIPEELEQLLRRQGVTEEQLDQLRRTGSIAVDGAGESNSITIDGITVSSSGDLTPEALAQLRRIRRFIPRQTMERLEMSSGEDIDGDGIVGPVPDVGTTASHDGAQHMAAHRAEAAHASGPFVKPSPARSFLLPILVVVVGAGAAITWLASR